MARTTDPEGHELHLHNASTMETSHDIELNEQIELTAKFNLDQSVEQIQIEPTTTFNLNQSDQTNTPRCNF